MAPSCSTWSRARGSLVALVLSAGMFVVQASDHSDVPSSTAGVRQAANITDLHAFVNGSNLVLAVATNPAIPKSATSYLFPTDVTFEVNIDTDSAVDPSDPFGDGGTIVDPGSISEEVTFRVRFRDDGSARIQRVVREGIDDAQVVNFFAGLRDDPFIRGPRQGRNIGALVLEVPLTSVVRDQRTLLLWASAKVEEFEGTFQELTGRSLRSMFPENNALNSLHPKHHVAMTGLRPDVMIFNTSSAAAFPNGRALTDDVIDLVGDPRVLGNDAPFPSTNDVPFLTSFPYLGNPHPPQ